MKLKLWGVRGSLPSAPSPEQLEERIRSLFHQFFDDGNKKKADVAGFLKSLPAHQFGGFGSNTPCLEVFTDKTQIVIDGGSGIRQLGYELMKGPCGKGAGEVHILFTHFHWDHLIGLPFFTPVFIPGNVIHFYAVQPDLPEIIQTVFKKPCFPVEFKSLGAKIKYHKLEPRKPFKIGDITATPYQLDHPDPCWGYKIEHGGKTFSHCVDTECTRFSREALADDLPLYQGLDLMVFDAQYTLMESIEKVNWGHASALLGLDLAIREGIKRVLFMHYDPAASDQKIALSFDQAMKYYGAQQREAQRNNDPFNAVDWIFAREGMIIEV